MTNKEKIESSLAKLGLTDYKWINPKEIIVVAENPAEMNRIAILLIEYTVAATTAATVS